MNGVERTREEDEEWKEEGNDKEEEDKVKEEGNEDDEDD